MYFHQEILLYFIRLFNLYFSCWSVPKTCTVSFRIHEVKFPLDLSRCWLTLVPQKMAVLYEAFCSWGNYKDFFFVGSLAFNNVGLGDTVVKAQYNEDINESLWRQSVKSTRWGGIWIVSKWGRNKIKCVDHEPKQLRSRRLHRQQRRWEETEKAEGLNCKVFNTYSYIWNQFKLLVLASLADRAFGICFKF